MAGTKLASWWQYSRWVYIIGRTLRLNYGTPSEKTAVKNYLTAMLPGRPWLAAKMDIVSTTGEGPVIATESDNSLARMVMAVGRDLKKIPMTDAEKTLCDTLFTATANRKYGDKGNLI